MTSFEQTFFQEASALTEYVAYYVRLLGDDPRRWARFLRVLQNKYELSDDQIAPLRDEFNRYDPSNDFLDEFNNWKPAE